MGIEEFLQSIVVSPLFDVLVEALQNGVDDFFEPIQHFCIHSVLFLLVPAREVTEASCNETDILK